MGKLTAIKTKSIFQSLLNNSKISEQAIHFILDTGQIYTHGIYINGAAYGTEANGAVNLSIAGVTKALSLSTHTHSNYLEKNSNIDLGSYIIKSGNNELLKWASNKLILGSPTYITGTAHTTRNSTNYDILDTGNFSVVAKTSTNISLQNVATIKYGSSTFQIDYAKRINGAYTFDNITYTSIGTTNVNNQQYGIITMYTDGSTPASYAQIRADIPNGKLEYRTSGSTTWKTIVTGALPTVFVGSGSNHASGLVPDPGATAGTAKFLCEDGTWKTPTYTSDTNTWRSILVNGTQKLSTAINSGGLDIINGTNTTVEWTSSNKLKINSVNTWTAWKGATDSANGTAGYMPAPTSAQRGQFLRGDGSWVSLNNYSLPTASSSTLGGVKTGAAITDTTGYTAVAIKDGVIYYKDTNTTYSFSNLQFQQTSGTNLMTYNSQAARTVLAGSNITFTHSNNVLTIVAKDTTYSTVTKSAAGLCPTLPNETTTTKYLRQDGTWVTPPNDNTWKAANASQEGYVPKSTANKILRANSDGALYWGDDANTTCNFSGTTFYSGNSGTAEHNCNNAVKNGNYYYTSNGPSGLGNSTSYGALYVQSYSDSWVGQIAQDYRNGRLWVRGRYNGTWQSWIRIANYNEIPSSLPANGGNADTVDNQHFKWSNDSNSPTYLWAANSSGTAFLCARGSMSVNYANSAGYAAYLPTKYDGGDKPNPQSYFSSTIGLRVAMTRYADIGMGLAWHDTLWINGYSGGDVTNMCALHFKRNGEPRFAISAQNNTGTSYGALYEVITNYNIGSHFKTINGQSIVGSGDITISGSVNNNTLGPEAFINGTTSELPHIVWHIPNVAWGNLSMSSQGEFFLRQTNSTSAGLANLYANLPDYLAKSGGTMTGQLSINKTGYALKWNNDKYSVGSNDSPNDFYMWSEDSTARFRLGTNSTERLTILANGNVGIGTQSPSELLHVEGTIYNSGYLRSIGFLVSDEIYSHPSLGSLYVRDRSVALMIRGGKYGLFSYVLDNGNVYFQVGRSDGITDVYDLCMQTAGGNVGIGVATTSYKLHVAGNCAASNFYTTSDIRKKDNIKPISNLLPIYEFNWKSDGSKSYGFIAQWLEQTNPELVSGKDYKHVNYSATLALYLAKLSNIVEETKEDLYAKIAKLENRIKELEASNKLR